LLNDEARVVLIVQYSALPELCEFIGMAQDDIGAQAAVVLNLVGGRSDACGDPASRTGSIGPAGCHDVIGRCYAYGND
jgi:hypothetical protein